ncbi:GNAT family N-acetyltransferase [Methylobrevis albus]|uniref:GNAT family N-acetyltransferase n=1 Tax=Methylobrevis albus TaxID=2793297 RepID=A0A931MZA3_9HYPH|nr:GNAT family N-acetyltransferase [Methylobrevis albus]MBH0237834.1 GNAT family N-acetyltransferase [Methylobrevis albus]
MSVAKPGAISGAVPGVALATARLWLDPPQRSDAPALAEALADLGVARWLSRVPHPYSLADAYAFIDGCAFAAMLGEAHTFAVRLVADGGARPLVGMVGLQGLPADPELGYWIAPAHWGRGLASEAAAAVVAFGFETLGVAAIRSGVFEGNAASLAVQAKLGFAVTGRSRVFCLARGCDLDHIDTRLARPAG